MPERAIYRIEVSRKLFTIEEELQFIKEAARAHFAVSRDALAVKVFCLTQQQAVTIRDGLEALGIHSSIGIGE
jgi:hypothetical protein